MSSSLVIFSKAAELLVQANTIQKAKELKSMAIVAGEWAKQKGMGREAIQHCRSYELRAERRMGECLLETERATGAKGIGKSVVTNGDRTPKLSDLNITKRESAEAQLLAKLPVKMFEEVVAGEKTKTQVRRERNKEEILKKVATLPRGTYRVFYADPPWKYGNNLDEATDGKSTVPETHYPCMSIAELCTLPVIEMAQDNAALFLWVTSPLLFECAPVVTAWGFKYKTSFVWDKIGPNMGHYNSVRHEFLLVCTRGSCTPDAPKQIDSVQSIQKSRVHSEKPEEFRAIIDSIYPTGPRIELFARKQTPGWETYGNQC